MDLKEELKSGGAYPSGPCSAWPQSRNEELEVLSRQDMIAAAGAKIYGSNNEVITQHVPGKVKASMGQMAAGLLKTGAQAVRNGRVNSEIREERYDTCKACPAFLKDSKRCSECGCFMEAKTWIGGNPKTLCPLKKWER